MRADFSGGTEQFMNVTFAVFNVDATLSRTQQRRRLSEILQPADALLLLNRQLPKTLPQAPFLELTTVHLSVHPVLLRLRLHHACPSRIVCDGTVRIAETNMNLKFVG